jgi:uroporphyrinogen-III synthase
VGKALEGKRIILGASRKTDEMTALIEKQGGTASVRSLQGTVYRADEDTKSELRSLVEEPIDWFIFTTGIGLDTLVELADELQIKEEFIHKIAQAQVASRGYKTKAALKKLEVKPVVSDDDGTTQGLVRQLEPYEFKGKNVIVQLHGEKAPTLIHYLQSKGAIIKQLLPYKHIAPEKETVATLCQELLQEKVDAVCFTTAIQVRSLFDYAKEMGKEAEIKEIFRKHAVATAVGKVTAEALREEKIERIIVPELERMGAMIIELARYYESLQETK